MQGLNIFLNSLVLLLVVINTNATKVEVKELKAQVAELQDAISSDGDKE